MPSNCGLGEDSWESLGSKEIKLVNPKGNQHCIFIGRSVAEAETPTLWPPHSKSQLILRDPDAGKDWRQKEKGKVEDEMVGWPHQLSGHEFEPTLCRTGSCRYSAHMCTWSSGRTPAPPSTNNRVKGPVIMLLGSNQETQRLCWAPDPWMSVSTT